MAKEENTLDTKTIQYSQFLNTAHNPIFPLVNIKLKPSQKQTTSVTINVKPEVLDVIQEAFLLDEICIYLPITSQMGIWNFDMVTSFRICEKLGIIIKFEEWIKQSRTNIADLTKRKKVSSRLRNNKALKTSQDFLKDLGLLNDVMKNPILHTTVKDVILAEKNNPTGIIYRLAMAIFHSKKLTGMSVIPQIEEMGSLYMLFINGKFYKTHKKHFSIIKDFGTVDRQALIKTMTVLIIAAYVYYSNTNEQK